MIRLDSFTTSYDIWYFVCYLYRVAKVGDIYLFIYGQSDNILCYTFPQSITHNGCFFIWLQMLKRYPLYIRLVKV